MKNYKQKYIERFGDNLTLKQIELIKKTLGYQSAILADSLYELKQVAKQEIKNDIISLIPKKLNAFLNKFKRR